MLIDAVLYSPEKEIDRAVKYNDWISAFATAVSYFEYYGAAIIKGRCKSLKIPKYKDVVKNMSVSRIAFTLRLLRLVDEKTYSKIRKAIEERNKLIHPERGGIGYKHTKERSRAIELLEDAKECIQKLREAMKGGNKP